MTFNGSTWPHEKRYGCWYSSTINGYHHRPPCKILNQKGTLFVSRDVALRHFNYVYNQNSSHSDEFLAVCLNLRRGWASKVPACRSPFRQEWGYPVRRASASAPGRQFQMQGCWLGKAQVDGSSSK